MTGSSRVLGVPEAEVTESSRVPGVLKAEMTGTRRYWYSFDLCTNISIHATTALNRPARYGNLNATG